MGTGQIFVAITAAGESRRMGRPKALLRWGEETFLTAMLAALARAMLHGRVGIVVGDDAIALDEEIRKSGAEALVNKNPSDGRFSSIRIAARWALDCGVSLSVRPSLLLWPVDCPAVDARTLIRLREEALSHPDENIVPTFEGRGGHPVILCEPFITNVVGSKKQANLRDLMHDRAIARRICPVTDSAILDNINRPEEYAEFLRRRKPLPWSEAIDG